MKQLPLLDVQKRIYLNRLLNKERDSSIINVICYLKGNIDVDRLTSALKQVFERNMLLRSHVAVNDDGYIFNDNSNYTYDIDHQYCDHELSFEVLKNSDFLQDNFDFECDTSYMRAKIFQNKNETCFVINCHHIIIDVFSGMHMFKQMFDGYNAGTFIDQAQESKQLMTLHDSIIQQNNSSKIQSIKAYYGEKLDQYMDCLQPISDSASKVLNGRIVIDAFDQFSPRELTGIFVYCLAKTLFKFYDTDILIIGVPVPNRNSKMRDIISCTTNVLPVFISKTDVLNEASLTEVFTSIKNQLYFNLRNQFFDFFSHLGSHFKVKNYIASVTYYPSDFTFSDPDQDIEFEYKHIFSPIPPNETHLMIRENGVLEFETQLGQAFVEQFARDVRQGLDMVSKANECIESCENA